MWELGLLRKLRLRAKVTCPSSQSRSTGHQELACKYQMPVPFFPLQHTASCHWTELTWTSTPSLCDQWAQQSPEATVSSGAPLPPAVISGFSGKNWARCLQVSERWRSRQQLCQILGTTENVDQTSLKQAWDIQWLRAIRNTKFDWIYLVPILLL